MNEPNPIQHFHQWFCIVKDQFPEIEVNAMALTTLGTDGFPNTRMVLLKQYTWEGFIFYTQYTSSKGKAIAKNSKVCLSFSWEKAKKRITILGTAEKVSQAQSEAYFEARPRGSQLSAWASQQSESVTSRKALEESYHHFEDLFKNESIAKPERWGGYIVRPMELLFEESFENVMKCIKYIVIDDLDWQKDIRYAYIPRNFQN
ncbi:pyridoxamine 5'-phosphate oxidase [Rasiella sp. SM2506]|uniref:pyridoxamine 5'-phosphate oxidase n=1 Tax=Rasiella sp. SM2506 TaxID=3423914 RepID=UPI003D7A626A